LLVPGGAFAQSGRTANAALVAAVMHAVGETPGAVIELCAGSGNFTRHLMRVATSVRASDTDAAAVTRGRRAAPAATWSRRPPQVPPEPAADLVLLDPPREGADEETLAAAGKALRRVVYVSCDPQTLARDARRLVGAGFRLTSAVALDLMPQTYHIEVVAIFDRP
jgi:23S rRNA (uracil1939-C5)-methyltransferase